MSDQDNPTGPPFSLKQQLLAALQSSLGGSGEEVAGKSRTQPSEQEEDSAISAGEGHTTEISSEDRAEESFESDLTFVFQDEPERMEAEILGAGHPGQSGPQREEGEKTDFDDTLSGRGMVPDANAEILTLHPTGAPSSSSFQTTFVKSDKKISGGSMADLSGYKDLSKAPLSFGEEETTISTLSVDTGYERSLHQPFAPAQHFVQEAAPMDVDTEFSGNVKTLIRLVNELPEGVTKQTGAQIIRLTMEAMGISMEDVLSEAQSAQSEMLDAVRANIKKIEEYKTVIRKLETDIKYYQGKANELSEIIDLFILSNTSSNKMPMPDDLTH